MEIVLSPIGVVRSPHREKVDAPRQGVVAAEVQGRIEVAERYEDALTDIEGFGRLWILFWFDQAERGGPNKVQPPRSMEKRGLFATRSPHRPNPIGMTPVRLLRREGRVLHVAELDMLDGTPVLDIKPYVPYADAFPDVATGWLTSTDPKRAWEVRYEDDAEAQLAWIAAHGGPEVRGKIAQALSLGPEPHAYRRIKKESDAFVLAVKEWRARFRVEDRTILVLRIQSGFRARELARPEGPVRALHSAFVARFG